MLTSIVLFSTTTFQDFDLTEQKFVSVFKKIASFSNVCRRMNYEQAPYVLACDTKDFNFNYQAKSFQFVSTTANCMLTEKRKLLGRAGARKMQNVFTIPFEGICAAVERVIYRQQSNQDSDVLGLGQQGTRICIVRIMNACCLATVARVSSTRI